MRLKSRAGKVSEKYKLTIISTEGFFSGKEV